MSTTIKREGLVKEFNITTRPELVLTDEELSDHVLQTVEDLNRQVLSAHELANKEFSPGVAKVFGEINHIDPYFGKTGLCPFSQPMKREKPFSHYCIELMVKDINGRLPRGKCRKQEGRL